MERDSSPGRLRPLASDASRSVGGRVFMAFGAHSELMQEGDGAGVLLTPGSSLWGSGFRSQDTRERQPATTGQSGTRAAGGWDSK